MAKSGCCLRLYHLHVLLASISLTLALLTSHRDHGHHEHERISTTFVRCDRVHRDMANDIHSLLLKNDGQWRCITNKRYVTEDHLSDSFAANVIEITNELRHSSPLSPDECYCVEPKSMKRHDKSGGNGSINDSSIGRRVTVVHPRRRTSDSYIIIRNITGSFTESKIKDMTPGNVTCEITGRDVTHRHSIVEIAYLMTESDDFMLIYHKSLFRTSTNEPKFWSAIKLPIGGAVADVPGRQGDKENITPKLGKINGVMVRIRHAPSDAISISTSSLRVNHIGRQSQRQKRDLVLNSSIWTETTPTATSVAKWYANINLCLVLIIGITSVLPLILLLVIFRLDKRGKANAMNEAVPTAEENNYDIPTNPNTVVMYDNEMVRVEHLPSQLNVNDKSARPISENPKEVVKAYAK